jgi:hypothetical protein
LSYVIIGLLLSLFLYFKLTEKTISNFLITFLLLFALTTSIFSSNYRYEDILLIFSYFGLGLIPAFFTLNKKLFTVFAYLIISFFFYQMFNGILPDFMFPRTSRNFISVCLLIGCSYHIISCIQNSSRPSFFIFLCSFIISIYAIGRGGIISFAILLFFYPFTLDIKLKYKVLIVFSFLLISVSGLLYFQTFLNDSGLKRFDSMGIESERSSINSDYLIAALKSPISMFFGADYNRIPSIVFVELNPHNSFIRLHVYYGLLGFIIFISFLVYSMIIFFSKRQYIYLLLISVLLIRSFLDSSAFHGPFDPIIFGLIFIAVKNKKIVWE